MNENAPVDYMERTRQYYRALGYDSDYVWSHYDDVPFAALTKPLAQSRLTLITTANPKSVGEQEAVDREKVVWSGDMAAAPDELYTDNLAWDKESTHTRDRECFLLVNAANRLVGDGVVGELAARFHGVPTDYSQRRTIEGFAPRGPTTMSGGRCGCRIPAAALTRLPSNREFGRPRVGST